MTERVFDCSEPNLLVRACNQLGQFLSNRETNLRYLALESMCLLANSEFSHDAVKKHQEVVILSMKVEIKRIYIAYYIKLYKYKILLHKLLISTFLSRVVLV